MEFDILVLSVGKPYSFETDDKQKIEGCKVQYLMTSDTSLTPICNEDSGVLGYDIAKETFPVSFYDQAKAVGVPFLAKARFEMRLVGGKQTLKMVGLDAKKTAKV